MVSEKNREILIGGFFAFYSLEEFRKLLNNKLARKCAETMEFCEIWLENARGNFDLLNQKNEIVETVLSLVGEETPIGIHGPILNFNLANPSLALEKAILREAKATIDIGEALGASYVLFHAGNAPFYLKRREVEDILVSRLESLVKYGKKKKVRVAVENVPYVPSLSEPYGSSMKEIERILKNVEGLYFVLDVPHLFAGKDKEAIIKKIHVKRLVAMHIHGFDGIRDHVAIDENNIIDYSEFLPVLIQKAENKPLYFNVEVVGLREMLRSIKNLKKMLEKMCKASK